MYDMDRVLALVIDGRTIAETAAAMGDADRREMLERGMTSA